jgi:predicted nucleotidyltransferase
MDPDFLSRLRSAAAQVFHGHRVLAAYAFGSRIHGRPRQESDLDIGYYLFPGQDPLPVGREMTMAADLSVVLGLEVDLRSLDRAPLETRGRILEEGVRIYSGDDVARVSLERSTLSFYHDYKDVFRHMHEVRLKNRARRGAV